MSATRARSLSALVLFAATVPNLAHAHPIGLATLRVQADPNATDTYDVTWRVSARESRVAAPPMLPTTCEAEGAKTTRREGASLVARWTARCDGGIAGDIVRASGDKVEVLISIFDRDGSVQRGRLTVQSARFTVASRSAQAPAMETQSTTDGALTAYLELGFEHVLEGWDHLLFVLLLLLLAWPPGTTLAWAPITAAITGFTLAHSVTLALSVTGLVQLPGPPIEAIIAWSVVVAAAAVVRDAAQTPMTWKRLLGVAGGFGLLHGFGFAGALSELLGNSPDGLLPALLGFNLGVEIGQLCFAACVVVVALFVRRSRRPQRWPDRVLAYGIGCLAAFWTVERVAAF